MMKSRSVLIALCALLASGLSLHAAATDTAQPLRPIAALDVPRYMGTWYEIARYPNWFQKKCRDSSRADYSLQPDGHIRVINRCRLENGDTSEAVGLARQIGPATSARLEVRFAPAWLSFLPMVWGDYWVIDLDEAYQLVAVSEPSRQYLWVLARTPQVDAAAYEALLARLARQGFDLGALETSAPQTGSGLPEARP